MPFGVSLRIPRDSSARRTESTGIGATRVVRVLPAVAISNAL
jgi:hypothetical protein